MAEPVATEEGRLRAALLDVADPMTALRREHPAMPWAEVVAKANNVEFLKGIALRALGNVDG